MGLGTKRGRTRERIAQVARDADTMREYEVRLGLATPGDLGGSVCKGLRTSFGISQTELAMAMDTTPTSVAYWEAGDRSPTFIPIVQFLIAELRLLSIGGEQRDYDPRTGLIGRIISCGVMTREEICNVLESLATVMAVDPKLPEVGDGE